MDSQLAVQSNQLAPMSASDLLSQVKLIQDVMKSVMKDGEHFGKIPGCGDKPTLLKSGAEKLAFVFHLAPTFDVHQTDLPNGHREYRVTCTMHTSSGNTVGQGVGCCSTMEGKFRFRQEVVQGQPVPQNYWDTKDPMLLGGPNRKAQKRDGSWVVVDRVEHDNPADYYNTVLKMAKKRAQVDATLTCTAASDIFTQDVEDMPEVIEQVEHVPVNVSKPSPIKAQVPPPVAAPANTRESAPTTDAGAWVPVEVVRTAKKPTKKPGQYRYGISCRDVSGNEFWVNTFSDTDANAAEVLVGQAAEIQFNEGKFGKDLTAIRALPQASLDDDIPLTE